MAEEKKSPKSGVLIIILIAILLLLAGAVPVYFVIRDSLPVEESSVTGGNVIPSEVQTGESLNVQDNQIPISFDPIARSTDGENFTCAIGNPAGAKYDMYLDMRADGALEEQVYMSGLLKPGQGITRFKTSKKFPKGNTDIVLVFTTVADDHKTLIAQSMMVLTLSVE